MEISSRIMNLRIGRLKERGDRETQRLNRTRNARLWITFIFCVLIFLCTLYPSWRLEAYVIGCYGLIFCYLMWKSWRLNEFIKRVSYLENFYKRQLKRSGGVPQPSYITENQREEEFDVHDDLNVFGRFSVFNLFDETFSDDGRNCLFRLLRAPESFQDSLVERQKKIRTIGENRWRWHRFLTEGGITGERISYKKIINSLSLGQGTSAKRDFILVTSFWIIWLLSVSLSLQISGILWGIYFVLAFSRMSTAIKSFGQGEGLVSQLKILRLLFMWLESEKNQNLLEGVSPGLIGTSLHRRLKGTERYLSFLSVQANPLIFIILNAIFPWSFIFSVLLEREKKFLHKDLQSVLEQVAYLEALCSLSLLWTYHTRVFPDLTSEKTLHLKEAYHPLIPRGEVVRNSVDLTKDKVVLLTGSNMAGKSTFLRTVAINQVLFLAGAPVFAQCMKAWSFPVLSCLQVSDSVRDGISYFHSEVLHLKKLLDKARETPHLFFIDEIYRGTNNKERFRGSYALISELSKTLSLGFVSTHDLELATLEEEGDKIVNYHFEDHFENNEMKFSYSLKKGPCTSTNALKIMDLNGLPT